VVNVRVMARLSKVSRVSSVSCGVSVSLRISEKPGMADLNQIENKNTQKNVFGRGFALDPLGRLTRFSRPSSWIKNGNF